MLLSSATLPFRRQQVRVKVDASCAGKACDFSGDGDSQAGDGQKWCEVLLAQHVPQGAYIDVDEVKVRWARGGLSLLAWPRLIFFSGWLPRLVLFCPECRRGRDRVLFAAVWVFWPHRDVCVCSHRVSIVFWRYRFDTSFNPAFESGLPPA